jgi:hypothetical protein
MIEEQALRVVLFTNAYKPTVSGVVTSISLFRRGLSVHTSSYLRPAFEISSCASTTRLRR